jgi:hypothetical protein
VTAVLTAPSAGDVADLLSALTGFDHPSPAVVERATRPDYLAWRDQVARLKGCTPPSGWQAGRAQSTQRPER